MNNGSFKIAFRNLRKHKVFSIINIFGLAVGFTIFCLIALYVADELSYDRSSENANRIYRVVHFSEWPGGRFKLAITPVPFALALKNDYPAIEAATRIDPEGGGTLTYGENEIKVNDILFTDNALLTIFQYPFLYGNQKEALSRPESIVLTESLSKKLFGDAARAVNKTITFQNGVTNLVTGVIKDIPNNAQMKFSALRSLPADFTDSWQNSYVYTYVLLHKGADAGKLEAELPGFFDRYLKAGMSPGTKYRIALQPLTSIHLHSNLDYEYGRNSDIRFVYLFSAMALLVLGIAIVNYINLSTARSSIRIREVGVRQALGADRKQLIGIFLLESVLFTMIAAVIGLMLSAILLYPFNELSGKTLSLWQFGIKNTLLLFILFAVFTGIAGGLYPAIFLSNFRTIPALKGQTGNMHSNEVFRKSLVGFQFLITVSLIAGSYVIYNQLSFVQNRDLGFNRDQVLSFHLNGGSIRERVPEFKNELLTDVLVEAAASASTSIGNNDIGTNTVNFEDNSGQFSATPTEIQSYQVDADYVPTMQIRVLKGRNFSEQMQTDKTSAILVNETLVKRLGWKEPVGKRAKLRTKQDDSTVMLTVIGVVKDFNIYSLQHKIGPLMLQMPPTAQDRDNIYARVNQKNISRAVAHLEAAYRKFDGAPTFEYHFLDQNFANQYETEKRQGKILLIFTILAILIACLGLFGLVTFTVDQRMKEIGVRQVLGASLTSIVNLISKDLVKPIGISIIIATPLAWYALDRWLQHFAYRIDISIWIFLGAGTLALLFAMIPICYCTIRAARVSPVKSLKAY